LALDRREGERIADRMADKPIAFLGHRGVVVSGRTAAKAFYDLYYLERAAQSTDARQGARQAVPGYSAANRRAGQRNTDPRIR